MTTGVIGPDRADLVWTEPASAIQPPTLSLAERTPA